MRKIAWLVALLMFALFAGSIVYGVFLGDVDYVAVNAEAFCFS
jgi:hypothetical protein